MASLKDIFDKNQYDLGQAARKSKNWFQQQTRLLGRQQVTPQKVMRGGELTARPMPGKLYMFLYDPKHKDTLPYYDLFPLVFPFSKDSTGFTGLNMHYLPYQMRILLLQRLMDFASNKSMDETTRLKYSWSLIDGVSRYRLAAPCVKKYLFSHVKTQLKLIPANDWATAMLLPVEQFVGTSKQNVWQDSLRG
jgi:hypothetical protein